MTKNRAHAVLFTVVTIGVFSLTPSAFAQPLPVTGWAWIGADCTDQTGVTCGTPTPPIGWVSFNCSNTDSTTGICGTVNYGVKIDYATGVLSSQAWIGDGNSGFAWLDFDLASVRPIPATGRDPFPARWDAASRQILGWVPIVAGADTLAWVHLCSGCPYRVKLNADGTVGASTPGNTRHYAWAGHSLDSDFSGLGWIDFRPAMTSVSSPTPPVTFPPPPVVFLTATPPAVPPGGSSLLAWSAPNATSCSAPWTLSSAASGSQAVSQMFTTLYSISCVIAGVTATAQVTVAISPLVAAGSDHTCARLEEGTVWCWGQNTSGQLGNGTFTSSLRPVQVTGITTATGIAAGPAHTCARLLDGTVRCWGNNGFGQLGNGTTGSAATPVAVTGLTSATAVLAKGNHTCALLADGTVQCWGYNFSGQLGNGTTTNSSIPVAVTGLTSATALTGGAQHTCAVLSDGTARCWGSNSSGQLGNGATFDASTPVAVSGLTSATAITAGSEHTCARLLDTTVQCWGQNFSYGELGTGTTTSSLTPVAVANLTSVAAIAAGGNQTCALLPDGRVKCWGGNDFGQLGVGTSTGPQLCGTPEQPQPCSTTPIQVIGITTAAAIGGGSRHTCAGLTDGTVKCWGLNREGQLGNFTTSGPDICGSSACSTIPVLVGQSSTATTPTGDFVQVSFPGPGVLVSFSSVVGQPGLTSLTTTNIGPLPPPGFQLAGTSDYYQLTTTAVYYAPVIVCINYSGLGIPGGQESSLRLNHYEEGTWVDRTIAGHPNTVADTICASVTDLSLFALFVPAPDTTPPVIVPTVTPAPNAAGWNRTDVTVSWSVTDPESGIVSSVGCALTTLTTETAGAHLTCSATNGVGLSASASVTIKIDKTPPAVTASRTPGPNAFGWTHTDVRVQFAATDTLSGLEAENVAVVFVSTEGAGQAVSHTFRDQAGNTAVAAMFNINIDTTLPTITATTSPPPNAAGWNRSDVTVSFACRDDLSGLARCPGPTPVVSDGANQLVTGTALDFADNTALASVRVNLDKTSPEAFLQFDPASQDLVLFGRDFLSGAPLTSIVPLSVVPTRWGEDTEHEEAEEHEEAGEEEKEERETEKRPAQLRTYQVLDVAGNTFLVTVKVKRAGHELKARLVSLQYQGDPALTPPRNKIAIEWAFTKAGALKELEQKVTVGKGKEKQKVEAKYQGKKNESTVKFEHPKPETKVVTSGLVLLRLATANGQLVIELAGGVAATP